MKNKRPTKMRTTQKRTPSHGGVAPGTPATAETLRMALDAAGMVTWEWDVGTGIIHYSDNVASFAKGQAIEPYCTVDSLLQMIHPEDRDCLAQALQRAAAENGIFSCEYRVRLQDDAYHWVLGTGKIVVMEDAKPVRILGVSQDITARKHAEQELQRRSRQLAELATELTMAEHRERRRLADLLHEHLQQLLVGARLQLHSLANRETGQTREQLERLNHTLHEILELTGAITRGLAPPVHLQKDLAAAFQWLAQDMLERHRLAVNVRLDETFAQSAEATAVLIFTAARELLLNVVKHAGVKEAFLSLQRHAGFLELEVSDQGKGFDPAVLQAPDSRQGFGLFSIRERAELLGGRLTVGPTSGRGTRVVLSLPMALPETARPAAARSDAPGAPHRPAPAASAPASPPLGNAIRIVFADDHRAVREGMISLLRTGLACDIVGEADNGQQAVECVDRCRPDVVIMDVNMPVMDGIEATRIITQRWPGVKVIGLSMHDDPAVIERMRSAGAAGYVKKAARPEALIAAIRQCAAAPRRR